MKLRTNNVPRPLLNFHELTAKEQEQLRLEHQGNLEAAEDWRGFRYHGLLWSLSEFHVGIEKGGFLESLGWQAIAEQSAFHALVIKVDRDGDNVTVGTVFANSAAE